MANSIKTEFTDLGCSDRAVEKREESGKMAD